MGKHLKTRVIEGLESTVATFEALPKGSTPHKRGVHYFRADIGVDAFKGGEKPAEGMKRYSRFYQYVYVAIYRELQREAKGEIEAVQRMKENEVDIEEISFEPVDWRPRMRSFSSPLRRAYNSLENRDLQPPDLQHIIFYRKIPRTTEEFAHVKKSSTFAPDF